MGLVGAAQRRRESDHQPRIETSVSAGEVFGTRSTVVGTGTPGSGSPAEFRGTTGPWMSWWSVTRSPIRPPIWGEEGDELVGDGGNGGSNRWYAFEMLFGGRRPATRDRPPVRPWP